MKKLDINHPKRCLAVLYLPIFALIAAAIGCIIVAAIRDDSRFGLAFFSCSSP